MKEELLRRVQLELVDVLNSINNDKIHHDGDNFHELLRDIEAALAQQNDHSEQHLDMVKAQTAQQEPDAQITVEHYSSDFENITVDFCNLEKGVHLLYTTPPQLEERNFCQRCGKRTADLTVIHTCTPPQENTWVGLDEKDFSAINQSCLTKLQAATSAESILKEKNT